MQLTIFTPTYNRAYCLSKLYESLERQTCKDFLWLIIDDGSSDNTEDLVKSFISKTSLNIQYVRQNNSGKHVAYNNAVELCNTELFFCVDSDDYISDDAVEIIIDYNKKYKNEKILGFYYKRILPNGKNMAMAFPEGVSKVGITELYHKYNFKGDTAIVLRTELVKGYYFPTFESEKFVTERVLYNEYDSIAPMIIVNRGIYISEYLPDGYTNNRKKLQVRNPYGTALGFLSESYHAIILITKIKNYAQYLAFCDLFTLDKSAFDSFKKPSTYIKLGGILISKHYKKIFEEQRSALQDRT